VTDSGWIRLVGKDKVSGVGVGVGFAWAVVSRRAIQPGGAITAHFCEDRLVSRIGAAIRIEPKCQ